MSLQRVANIGLDGTDVSISFSSTTIPCIKMSYGDAVEKAMLSYMGAQQQDERSSGTYKTSEVSITMSSLVFRTVLMPLLPTVGAANVIFPLVVNRQNPNIGDDSDMLDDFCFTNFDAAVENSNALEQVELKGSVMQIYWTDRRIAINRRAGLDQGVATL